MILTVILAGGKGERMGGNKPLQPYSGTSLISATLARLRPQAADIVINAGVQGSATALSLSDLGLPLIFDENDFADLGPLSGVLTALKYAEARGCNAAITAPCDMPHLPDDMMAQLLKVPKKDIVHFSGVRDYPLCALWQVSLRPNLEAALTAAQPDHGLSVMRYLSTQQVHKIVVLDDSAFVNINSPQTDQ
jgi:molybdenum cofactor guanylyltransferase